MNKPSADQRVALRFPRKKQQFLRLSHAWGITATPIAAMLLFVSRRDVLTDWHWYRDLNHEQRLLYEELMRIETEVHLSPRDCKQLIKGLMRIGIKTPKQLRDWFLALAEADNECEC